MLILLLLAGAVRSLPAAAAESSTPPFIVIEVHIESGKGERHRLRVELAETPEQRRRGLQHRRDLAPHDGMLFDFQVQRPVVMWMADTPLSLDMLFIREDGEIVAVVAHTEPFSRDLIPSGGPVRLVLELAAGEAERRGIRVGDRLLAPRFDATPADEPQHLPRQRSPVYP